ncbi:hypothetical protein [Mycolicibacterium holsaticum]|uniref:Uncharacterized protein n=1 Tax=Mycolicibacterium holsaticum TaxID=152142 RepID=A0A1E3S0C9_9MYCO|nr:hypothetical protein [Mycolicibacterium holsaticum]ODQ95544.1 hypothetical protein BHQ17_04475 [Mycolicibacterium holsaticum]
MVNITASRMWTVTDAKPKLNSLVSDAQSGQMTHIVSGAQVVAHLVPPTTWIVDDPLALEFMLRAVIDREAAWAVADEMQCDGGQFVLTHAGDVLGRVLGWAWRTDPDKIYMRAVTDYAQALGDAAKRPMAFADIAAGLAQSLGGGALERSEVIAALRYAEKHWQQWVLPQPQDAATATKSSQ